MSSSYGVIPDQPINAGGGLVNMGEATVLPGGADTMDTWIAGNRQREKMANDNENKKAALKAKKDAEKRKAIYSLKGGAELYREDLIKSANEVKNAYMKSVDETLTDEERDEALMEATQKKMDHDMLVKKSDILVAEMRKRDYDYASNPDLYNPSEYEGSKNKWLFNEDGSMIPLSDVEYTPPKEMGRDSKIDVIAEIGKLGAASKTDSYPIPLKDGTTKQITIKVLDKEKEKLAFENYWKIDSPVQRKMKGQLKELDRTMTDDELKMAGEKVWMDTKAQRVAEMNKRTISKTPGQETAKTPKISNVSTEKDYDMGQLQTTGDVVDVKVNGRDVIEFSAPFSLQTTTEMAYNPATQQMESFKGARSVSFQESAVFNVMNQDFKGKLNNGEDVDFKKGTVVTDDIASKYPKYFTKMPMAVVLKKSVSGSGETETPLLYPMSDVINKIKMSDEDKDKMKEVWGKYGWGESKDKPTDATPSTQSTKPKKITKQGYNKKTNKTQFIYDDGTKETVDGNQTR